MSRGFILKNGSLLVSTEAPGGLYNPEQLMTIARISEDSVAIVKATEDQRLALIVKEENLDQVAQDLSGVGLGVRHYLDGIHQATSCIGKFCSEYQQDSLKDAVEVTEALREFQSQNPLRIAMNGCGRCCNPCHTMDISLVGDVSGYRMSLGGKSSIIPELAQYVAEGVPAEELPFLIQKVVEVYNRLSEGDDSIGKVIEKHGLMPFAEVLAPYSQDASASPDGMGFGTSAESSGDVSDRLESHEGAVAEAAEVVETEMADGPQFTDDPSRSTSNTSGESLRMDPEIEDLPQLAESDLDLVDIPVDSADNSAEDDLGQTLDTSDLGETSLASSDDLDGIEDLEDHEEVVEGTSESEESDQAKFEKKLESELSSQMMLRDAADDSNQTSREEAFDKVATTEDFVSDDESKHDADESASVTATEIIEQLSVEDGELDPEQTARVEFVDAVSASETSSHKLEQQSAQLEVAESASEVVAEQTVADELAATDVASSASEYNHESTADNKSSESGSGQSRSTEAVDSLGKLASNVQAFPRTAKASVADIDFAADGSLRLKFTSGIEVELSGEQLKEGTRTLSVAGHQIKIEVSQHGCEIQVGGVKLMLPVAAA